MVELQCLMCHNIWEGNIGSYCPVCYSKEGLTKTLMDATTRIAALESSLAERERECERLRAWKESATLVESEWDAQAIATMLGGIAGDSCRRVVAVKVPRLIARAEAAESALTTKTDECNRWKNALMSFVPLEAQQAMKSAEITESALAAAREENERLRGKLEATKGWVPAAKADIDRAVESSLRARDEGRVERAKRCMQACLDDQEIDYTVTDAEARAVLAAADRMEP